MAPCGPIGHYLWPITVFRKEKVQWHRCPLTGGEDPPKKKYSLPSSRSGTQLLRVLWASEVALESPLFDIPDIKSNIDVLVSEKLLEIKKK